jgi:hypothetical protein
MDQSVRRISTDYRAGILELTEDLRGNELVEMLAQLSFSRDPDAIHTITIDRGVRDFLVSKLRGR